jgi:hypothetical protein
MAVDWELHLTAGEVVGDGGSVLWLPCRGYNPGYTKVPLFINLYLLYSYFIRRNIEEQANSNLGRINQAQSGIYLTRPAYSLPGRDKGLNPAGPALL